MGEVVEGNFITTLDVPVKNVLDGAAELCTAVVIGFDADGSFELFSSTGDTGQMLLLLEMAKRRLMQDVYD